MTFVWIKKSDDVLIKSDEKQYYVLYFISASKKFKTFKLNMIIQNELNNILE